MWMLQRLTAIENRLMHTNNNAVAINNRLADTDGCLAAIKELSVGIAVLSAQNTNITHRRGNTLVPVRYPDGRLPEANRPPLTSLRAIEELNPAIARSYANVHSYNLQLPPNATNAQVQRALADHIG
ncbi:hypothetical protein Clacol_000739 [Clathrus columnatus]|uniref:Mug135-like C-terminal domain-containing protein n=1 Tax=Clathrus columnatus TaxID=1419009 RepID=A0AAV4ZZ60_9AGAM|nr:hypothetical protein Clacol_000739 [Clathrus columnatus]